MNDPTGEAIAAADARADIARRQADEYEEALHAMAMDASRRVDAANERARVAQKELRDERDRSAARDARLREELERFRTYRSGSRDAAVDRLVSQLHSELRT